MNLETLKSLDPAAINGILAAAALSNSPDPGVGERPLVLRNYARQAAATLAEIRDQLRIPADNYSDEARAKISNVLASALRQSILSHADADEVLKRIGNAGLLPTVAYNVVQPPEFQATFYRFGVSRSHVEDAVKHPDDHQHLMTEGLPASHHDMSLFMKRIVSREQSRRHWFLVQTHRTGSDQRVGAAWRVYPDAVRLDLARQPIDVLHAFVDVYGVPVTVGDTRGLFIEPRIYPAGSPVKVDWTGAPPDHFVSISHTTDAEGRFRLGLIYCIDLERYGADLRKRGIAVVKSDQPLRQTISQTTTLYPK
jgi:hypothetical protein